MAYVNRYPNHPPPLLICNGDTRTNRSNLKRAPNRIRKNVAFGPISIRPIPSRQQTDGIGTPEPTPIPHTELISPIYGKKVGSIGMNSGLLILGDPEEFYEFFKQYPTWEECLASLNGDHYQWTGAPNISGLIIRDSQPHSLPFRLYVKNDSKENTRELHLF
jgi:hypothetical protein